MSKSGKVDLSLIKRLVSELDLQLKSAELASSSEEKTDYAVELAKAIGLCTAMSEESKLLINDIKVTAVLGSQATEDLLSTILTSVKSEVKN